jgi:hypothetical protein
VWLKILVAMVLVVMAWVLMVWVWEPARYPEKALGDSCPRG